VWAAETRLSLPAQAALLPGPAALGRIESERVCASGKPSQAVRYVTLSRRLTPQRMLAVVRVHWGAENHLHRQLDVVFFEADARPRTPDPQPARRTSPCGTGPSSMSF
jgi:hypothetical protein